MQETAELNNVPYNLIHVFFICRFNPLYEIWVENIFEEEQLERWLPAHFHQPSTVFQSF